MRKEAKIKSEENGNRKRYYIYYIKCEIKNRKEEAPLRNEYPRPDFVRSQWKSLNGQWNFGEGDSVSDQKKIEVPFVPQSELSGIHSEVTSDHLVYERDFEVPQEWAGKRVLLHFGAVDYLCRVWVNGHCVGSHQGGQTSFSFDITQYLQGGREHIKVAVTDYLDDECIPRGKQFWQPKAKFIWYTQSSGIWQSVWLEPVEDAHICWMHFTPDIDKGVVDVTYQVSDAVNCPYQMNLNIRFGDEQVYEGTVLCHNRRGHLMVDVFEGRAMRGSFHFTGWYWTPEQPSLFDVTAKLLTEGQCRDTVESYFGMRKIHVQDGKVYLNNQPYYQKLLLDQGYWKEGLMTAPSEQAYIDDITRAKEMGFNGCRKHEKVEDPLFLYWADRLGFLVWESMSSFWSFNAQSGAAFVKEWCDVIQRDYNHPCIVVWNMMNESWGIPRVYDNEQQQHFARAVYHLAHGLDHTRLVIANDGWELTENDICALHSYKHGEEEDKKQQERFRSGIKSVEGMRELVEKPLFAKGFGYEGQPVLLTEIGGINVKTGCDVENKEQAAEEDWGYTSVGSAEDFLKSYERLIDSIYESDLVCGFCYTQLADIEQEKNGLLNEQHQYKADAARIKEINDKKITTSAFTI